MEKSYLHIAAIHNSINVAKLLIANGVDVNMKMEEKKSVYASTNNSERFILHKDGDIVVTENDGKSRQIATGYGSAGVKGESGAAIYW